MGKCFCLAPLSSMLGCSLCTSMRQLPSTNPPPFKHGAHRVCPTQFKSTSIKCFPPFSLFQTKMNILTQTHPPLKLQLHHYSVSTSYTTTNQCNKIDNQSKIN